MIGKKEILLKLSDYQKSVLNLKQKCDQLNLHFEMNTERFFETPIPFDVFFANKINETLELYTKLNDLKLDHNSLLREARNRPARIKTGNVKIQISQQLELINTTQGQLEAKVQQLVDIYTQNRHFIFGQITALDHIQNIINSLDKMLVFFKNHSDKKDLIEKLTAVVSDSKLAQTFCRENNFQFQVIDKLSQELSKLRLENESLKLQVDQFLGKKEQSDKENRKEINFFSKAP
ncbi:hypothetical protein [Legionella sp. 227]|uniref:hypothetical protein n=1 Tax=Legionella sp. 227 TaxID=3367288 RepID=UPI00370D8934